MSDAIRPLALNLLPDLPQIAALKRLAAMLWDRDDVAALWLGGSFARGEADEYSDVDLRVAVSPAELECWQRPDFDDLFKGEYRGSQLLSFGACFLHHLITADGAIFDLLVQSDLIPPPHDATFVLGCRDDGYAKQLAEASLEADHAPPLADPATIRQAIIEFWLGSHKHRKVLARNLDLIVPKGMEAERATLLRLWTIQATGQDNAAVRMTIHTLTHMARIVDAAVGKRALELIGAPLTDRAAIIRAIERNRDEVAGAGRALAQSMGFDYPEALEETVRRAWHEFLKMHP